MSFEANLHAALINEDEVNDTYRHATKSVAAWFALAVSFPKSSTSCTDIRENVPAAKCTLWRRPRQRSNAACAPTRPDLPAGRAYEYTADGAFRQKRFRARENVFAGKRRRGRVPRGFFVCGKTPRDEGSTLGAHEIMKDARGGMAATLPRRRGPWRGGKPYYVCRRERGDDPVDRHTRVYTARPVDLRTPCIQRGAANFLTIRRVRHVIHRIPRVLSPELAAGGELGWSYVRYFGLMSCFSPVCSSKNDFND